jgi:hypothetical protein
MGTPPYTLMALKITGPAKAKGQRNRLVLQRCVTLLKAQQTRRSMP